MSKRETVSNPDFTASLTLWGDRSPGGQRWQANLKRDGENGYVCDVASSPVLAVFGALAHAGLAGKPLWVHPNPFTALSNALDRNIISVWSEVPEDEL